MVHFFKNLSLKNFIWISPIVLMLAIILNFYGLYSNKFYFLKFDNYIFPMLSAVHFLYLYVLWYKLRENELPDPQMRNVEFSMYVVLIVYVFKLVDSVFVVLSYFDYEDYIIPQTFLPMGSLIVLVNFVLIGATVLTFIKRKQAIGAYSFDNFNENLDSWQDQA